MRFVALILFVLLIVGLVAAPTVAFAQDAPQSSYPLGNRVFMNVDTQTGYNFEVMDLGDSGTAGAFTTIFKGAIGTDADTTLAFENMHLHATIPNIGDGDGAAFYTGELLSSGKLIPTAMLVIQDGQYVHAWLMMHTYPQQPDGAALVKLAKAWFAPTHPRSEPGVLLDQVPNKSDLPKGYLLIQETDPQTPPSQ